MATRKPAKGTANYKLSLRTETSDITSEGALPNDVALEVYKIVCSGELPKTPDGYKIVPLKPTDEMMRAGLGAEQFGRDAAYQQMVAAAPGTAKKADLSPIAAIKYAATCDDPKLFLEQWIHGDWPEIKRDWPDVPEEIYPTNAVR